jgi:CheY-like chemotaxis protein
MIDPKQCVILMADDDPDDRLLVKDALAECRASSLLADRLRCVEDGEELMDYLRRRGRFAEPASSPRPDLILLDLNMPRKDGREALREIRATDELRRIPVVVFTTSKADTDIALIYDLGANSFVTKPVAFDVLVSTLSVLTQYWLGVVELPSLPAHRS